MTFPVNVEAKAPAWSNKQLQMLTGRPVVKGEGGYKIATKRKDGLRALFRHKGAQAVGMPTGKINNVIVLDLDIYKPEDKGGDNARSFYEKHKDVIDATTIVRSQRGGLHAYFRYQPGHRKNELGDGIEVQTDGAYVLLPPSGGYSLTNSIPASDFPPPPWEAKGSGGEDYVRGLHHDDRSSYYGSVNEMAEAVISLVGGSSVHNASNRIAYQLMHMTPCAPSAGAFILRALIAAGQKQPHGLRRDDYERFDEQADDLMGFHHERAFERHMTDLIASGAERDLLGDVEGLPTAEQLEFIRKAATEAARKAVLDFNRGRK